MLDCYTVYAYQCLIQQKKKKCISMFDSPKKKKKICISPPSKKKKYTFNILKTKSFLKLL